MSHPEWLQTGFALLPTAIALLLASARWGGFVLTLPLLANAGLSLRMRLCLGLVLGVVVLPVASSSPATLELTNSVTRLLLLPAATHDLTVPMDLAFVFSSEALLGAVLGMTVQVVLAGVATVCGLYDRAGGGIFGIGSDTDSEGSSTLTIGLAVIVFLTLPPVGGHLLLADALLNLFHEIPVGTAASPQLSSLLVVMVEQSLQLALHVAAPLLAINSLLQLTWAWWSRSASSNQLAGAAPAARAVLCMAVLVVTLPGIVESLGGRLESMLFEVPQLVTRFAGGTVP